MKNKTAEKSGKSKTCKSKSQKQVSSKKKDISSTNRSSVKNNIPLSNTNNEMITNSSNKGFFQALQPFTDKIPLEKLLDFQQEINSKVKEYSKTENGGKKEFEKEVPKKKRKPTEKPVKDEPVELDKEDSDIEFIGEFKISKSEEKRRKNLQFNLALVKTEIVKETSSLKDF